MNRRRMNRRKLFMDGLAALLAKASGKKLDFRRLPPAKRALFLDIARRRMGGERLVDFITRVWPHEPPPRHLLPLLDLFEQARLRQVRALVSMPPRHGKSVSMQRAVAWWLTHSPASTCAYACYNDTFAGRQSRRTRQFAHDSQIELSKERQAVHEWLTPEGGGVVAAGVGGGLTGHGVSGIACVDDPYKDFEQANSTLYREHVWDWFHGVLKTRLEGPSSIIVTHTRWAESDLIGQLMEEQPGEWEYINLPALAEEDDPLGRAPGEALWPERFSAEYLLSERTHNEFVFQSMYQGQPRSKYSRLFYGPPRYYDPRTTNFKGCTILIGADPAASEKTSADFSAAVVLVLRPPFDKPTVYLREVWRGQVTVPRFAVQLLAMQRRHGCPAYVESVAGFAGVPQLMRELEPNLIIHAVVPKGAKDQDRRELPPEMLDLLRAVSDKYRRAQLVASCWNDGRFLLPTVDPQAPSSGQAPPWLGPYVKELTTFTGVKDAHDDQVDATSTAFNAVVVAPAPIQRGARVDPARYG